MLKLLSEKIKEAAGSVLPISAVVVLAAFTPLTDFTAGELVMFILCAVLLIIGIALFNLGADAAMTTMGKHIGAGLVKSGSLRVLLIVGFVMGILITVAEPDLSVLASQVSAVINSVFLIAAVSLGVGIALLLSAVRSVYGFSILYYLVPGYFISLLLSLFVPRLYTAIAFDSGGVASGPLTSCFILPFFIGACVTLKGEGEVLNFAFGVVAMVAMTPLITIQCLGFKSIADRALKERIMMKRILDADDEQIIYF